MTEEETGRTNLKRYRFGSEHDNSCRGLKIEKKGINQDADEDEDEFGEGFTPDESFVDAPTLKDALEHFCSTCVNLEAHVGRVVRRNLEPQTVPKGYNPSGQKYDTKPALPDTKDIPDDQIIQVWLHGENATHWFWGDEKRGYGDKKLGDDKLVFELPLSEVWSYDQWGNVEHPALPAPAAGNIDVGTELVDVRAFKGKSIRTLNRAEIALVKRSITAQKNALKLQEQALNDLVNKLGEELEFRSGQLKYLSFYLGRGIKIQIISKGPKAPDSEPVHIRQRVLYMAEEVGTIEWNEVGFDFRSIKDFDNWVVNPKNLAIIAPEPKSIIFLKPRRSDADYGDPIMNFFMNVENNRVYALLRNGQTVYRAQIAVAIPDRLFPEEEKFEHDLERKRDSNIRNLWPFGWDWKDYEKKWNARKKWYAKGFTDADFENPIPYRTKEEMLADKAKQEAKIEAQKENPKELVPIRQWDLEDVYKDYQEDLKEFFYGLSFIQGVFDRTDIFGHLQGKVNVFTGLGLKGANACAKLVYDMSETRMLPDKKTPSLVAWLRSEAEKVKAGDFVVVKGEIYRGNSNYPTHVNGIAQVVKARSGSEIMARMNRKSYYYNPYRDDPKPMKSVVHKLKNRDGDDADDIRFYPWNLPMDKLRFYMERRADRDKYWDNLLVDLLRLKTMIVQGKKPEVSTISSDKRLDLW